jgi:prophage maintenance system killer protein
VINGAVGGALGGGTQVASNAVENVLDRKPITQDLTRGVPRAIGVGVGVGVGATFVEPLVKPLLDRVAAGSARAGRSFAGKPAPEVASPSAVRPGANVLPELDAPADASPARGVPPKQEPDVVANQPRAPPAPEPRRRGIIDALEDGKVGDGAGASDGTPASSSGSEGTDTPGPSGQSGPEIANRPLGGDESVPTTPTDPVILNGAGAVDYGTPPALGGMEPLTPVTDADGAFATPQIGTDRALTPEELAATLKGRAGPSTTVQVNNHGPGVALRNLDQAASKVNDWVAAGEDLTREKLAELNKILRQGEPTSASAGKFRNELVKPGDDRSGWVGHMDRKGGRWYSYADPNLVPRYLDDFFRWYNANKGTMNPVELAGKAYQQLVRIHPFKDANGRTTRLAADMILQKKGLPPAILDDAGAVHEDTATVVRKMARGVERTEQVLRAARESAAQTTTPETSPAAGADQGGSGLNHALGDEGASEGGNR